MFFFFFLISLSACNPKSPESKTNDASKTASLAENKSEELPSALEPEDYDISTTDLGSGNVGASVTFNEPEEYASYVVTIDENDTSSPNEPNEPNTNAIVEGIYGLSYEVCGASVTFDCTELGNYTSISLSACNNEACGPSVQQTLSCPNIENTSEELPPIATILEADQEILALARSFKSEVTNLINSGELTKDAKALLEPIVAKADCDIVADFDTILALITEEEKLSTEAIIAIAVGVTTVAAVGIATAVVLAKRAKKLKDPTKNLTDEIEGATEKTADNTKTNKSPEAETEAKNNARTLSAAANSLKAGKNATAAKRVSLADQITIIKNEAATKIQAVFRGYHARKTTKQAAATKIQAVWRGRQARLEAKKIAISNFVQSISEKDIKQIETLIKTSNAAGLITKLNSLVAPNETDKIFKNIWSKATSDPQKMSQIKSQLNYIKNDGPINVKKSLETLGKIHLLTQDGPSAFDNFKAYCVALVQEVAELKLLIDTESIKLASGGEVE